MDISTLPYEIQFKYLLPLSYKDIIHYCLTATTPLAVCRTQAFWELKAKREFGITGYIGEETPDLDFARLEEAYINDPASLLPYLIRTGQFDKAKELLPLTTIGQFIVGVISNKYGSIRRHRKLNLPSYTSYEIQPSTIELFEELLSTNNISSATFILLFIKHAELLTRNLMAGSDIMLLLLGRLFELVIDKGRYWLADVIGPYVNPMTLRAFVNKSFYDAIEKGDLNAVMYFEDTTFSGAMDKITKVFIAIKSGNEASIHYYRTKYHEVFANIRGIDTIVSSLIIMINDEPLETMLQLIPPQVLKSLATNENEALDAVKGWISFIVNNGLSERKYNYLVNYYNQLLE